MFLAFIKIHVLGYLWCYHDSLFFLEFSSLVITKEGTWWNLIGLATFELFWHLYLTNLSPPWSTCTPMRFHQVLSFVMTKDENSRKTMNHDNTKGIPIHESLWMPRTCGLIHPLFNYSGDHQCHGCCMILWCWGCPNGRTDPECPVHVDSPTPCLIIRVTINPMNIMVPKVSWWMNVQYVWTHPPLD